MHTFLVRARSAALLFLVSLCAAVPGGPVRAGDGRGAHATHDSTPLPAAALPGRARLESGVSLMAGRAIYRDRCVSCHGPRGRGTEHAAGDFSAPLALVRLDAGAIAAAVAAGHDGALSPPLDAQARTQVARFVRTYLMLPAPDADAETGRAIYAESCSVCHGDRGDAASWARNSLNPAPADFTAHGLAEISRQEMIDAITFGSDGTAMMPFAVQLTREEIAATVDYIRLAFMGEGGGHSGHDHGHGHGDDTGWPGGLEPDPVWGRAFYDANCAECHGRAGDGEGPRAYFMVIKPENFTGREARAELNREELFEYISEGVTGTTMPAWSTVLSDQQIVNVGEYVHRAFIAPDEAEEDRGAPGWRPAGEVEAGSSKKNASCGTANDPALERGRTLWNANCYFCHGYDGDARTEAAQVLDPPPRELTAAGDLTRARILEVLRVGSPGTAMKPFSDRLTGSEMSDLAAFVLESFARCDAANTRYHIPANGWPDHAARYGPAYPFVSGEIALDVPDRILTAGERAGRALFRSACISCHEGRVAVPEPLGLGGSVGHAPDPWAAHHEDEDYETPTVHDIPPEIRGLTAAEAEGRALYAKACESCHAADGSGMNWIGRFLEPSPPDFRAPAFAADFDARAFAAATLEAPAGTTMPSFAGVLSEAEARAIAAYVARAFAGEGSAEAQ